MAGSDVHEKKIQEKENILKLPAKPWIIQALYDEGHLTDNAKEAALDFIQPLEWWFWANRLLLFLGAALVLAGIVFFFAFNWEKMIPPLKFALIEAGILVCVGSALKIGMNKIVGQVFLLSASLLVGVFLAVFGQVYQTGADAYELFTGWSLLILGWVIISKFAALWIMWLALVNTSLILYWDQVLIPNHVENSASLLILLSIINTAALVLSLYGLFKKIDWLDYNWHYRLILASILFFLAIGSLDFIIENHDASVAPLLGLIAFLCGSYWYFRSRRPDMVSLAMGSFTVCIVLLTAIGRLMFHGNTTSFIFLLFGITVLGVFSGAAFWLRNTAKKIEGENHDV